MRLLPQPPLMVITDRSQTTRRIEDVVDAVFAGGCRWVSLREKDLPASERVRLLYRLVSRGEKYKALVGVHEDYISALATGAEGIHLAQAGLIGPARLYLGPATFIGLSTHSLEEARHAAALGADYVTLSPIFETVSKPGYGPPLGLAGLAAIAPRCAVPVVALGGIDETNAAYCIEAGASGIAVMGAAMRADDPAAMIARLIAAVTEALAARDGGGHSSSLVPNREAST